MARRRRRRTAFGFNDDYGSLESRIRRLKRVGADTVRFPIDPKARPNTDRAVATMRKHGIRPIISSAGWNHGPATKRKYAREMAGLARRYPKATLQLWNEPNLIGGYVTGDRPEAMSAKQAGRYATAAARAIRKVNPKAKIIGPSIAPVDDWKPYFRKTYKRIPRKLGVDVGMNLYPEGKNKIRELRRAYKMGSRFGDVHVTELDMDWRGKPRGTQAQTRAYKTLKKIGAKSVLFHGSGKFLDDPKARRALRRARR